MGDPMNAMERLLRPTVDLKYPEVTRLFWSPILSFHDLALIATCGIFIYTMRALLTRLVFNQIAHAFGVDKQKFRDKLIENMWYCVYYPIMMGFAWYILQGESFFPWNAAGFWTGFPNYSDWATRPLQYFYYLFQLGFYVQGMYALLAFETKRKDFIELCVHHLVTIMLILFSYCGSQHRIGLNVLIIHDLSDIILYSVKVFHYLDKYGRRPSAVLLALVNGGFVVFAGAFAYSRNYIFPRFVVWPSLQAGLLISPHCPDGDCLTLAVRSLASAAPDPSHPYYLYDAARRHWTEISYAGACVGGHCVHSGAVLIGMMVVLELLHVFWLFMILRMLYRSFFQLKQVKQDIRSDSEDEAEWNEKKRK